MSIIMINGSAVNTDDILPQTLTYDGSGNLQTCSFTLNGKTYTQTYSYTGGNLTGTSAWVVS